MPLDLPYRILDVFTDVPLAGNPLAVVIDDEERCAPELMQRVAAELNLSETVFLRPARSPGCDVAARIFTPTRELPFAGHPTIGAAIALLHAGRLTLEDERGRVVLEEGVGGVSVDVVARAGHAAEATLRATEAPERIGDGLAAEQLARVLALPDASLVAGEPAGVWSCGVDFQVVPLVERGALGRCRLDPSAWQAAVGGRENDGLHDLSGLAVLAPMTTDDAGARWLRARVFAPGAGVVEDPATGSAAVAALGWLARDAPDGDVTWTIEQGVEMGRPSRLVATASVRDGRAVSARVGGCAVPIASGTLHLP